MRAPAVEWAGQTLYGKWKVEQLIAVGGTSTVLRARHRNGRRAALKVLHPHLAAHERTRGRFLREGRLANLVDHPGVVAVLDDFVTEDGTVVLVLELVTGENLASRAKSSGGALEPREVVEAACAVLEILAVAHDAGVIHRDVKPENVLRRSDGGYKLADFGLAGLGHELGMVTGTGVALGTPAYMSPEQARADMREVDARTDLWGLGASMFTLLTGRFLHSGSAPKNLVVAAATEPVPPVRSLEPGIPEALAEVIDRAVCMDKEERWPNARAMLAALSALDLPASGLALRPVVTGEAGAPTAPSSLTSWSRPETWRRSAAARSRRLPRSAAVVLVSLSAVLVLWAAGLFRWRSGGAGAGDGTDPEAKSPATEGRNAIATHPLPADRNVSSAARVSAERALDESRHLETKSEASQVETTEPRARKHGVVAPRKAVAAPMPSAALPATPASANAEPPAPAARVESANSAIEPRNLYRR